LNESDSFENFGYPKSDLLLIVVLAWIIVYFCIWKGVKSTGKVVYITALFPYLLLIIFLIRAVTLDGAIIGLEYFFIPKWEKLLEAQVDIYLVFFHSILLTLFVYLKKISIIHVILAYLVNNEASK
jgi:solute carrier family 6 (neurotransmitter transporter, glycine) member 5/9